MARLRMSAAGTLVLFLLILPTAHAQESAPTQLWTVNADPQSWAVGAARGPDGHPVVAGGACPSTSCDFRLIKYNSETGDVIWDITDDGTGSGSQDDPRGIALGADGKTVVVGTSCDGVGCRVMLKRYAENGSRIWTASYGPGGQDNFGENVAIGPDGNLVVVGRTCVSLTDCAMLVISINRETSDAFWSTTFDAGAGFDSGFGVTVGFNGDAIVTGASCAPVTQLCDFRTMRFAAADGAIVWNRSFDSGEDNILLGEFGYDIAFGPDGNPIVSGVTCKVATSCDFRTIRRDGATGDILWNVVHGKAFDGVAYYDGGLGTSIVIGGDGNPVVVGQTCKPDNLLDCRPVAFKLRGATGELMWDVPPDGTDSLSFTGVTAGYDGNPIVAGTVTAGEQTSVRTTKYLITQMTTAGSNIQSPLNGGITQPGGVSLTFDNVTTAGNTSLETTSVGPTPPVGFGFMGNPPTYFEIETTAVIAGQIVVCLNYSGFAINIPESDLKLLHFDGSAWQDVTVSVDTNANVICGESTSLSPFAIAEEGPTLRSVGPASVWVGVGNIDSIGIRFDLRVEVFRNDQLIGSGQLDSVAGAGLNRALVARHVIPLTSRGATVMPSGSTLRFDVLVRNACAGSGELSGLARLWYDGRVANDQFRITTTEARMAFSLRPGFVLSPLGGQWPAIPITRAAGAPCSPFKSFGSWTTTLP